MNLTTGTGGPSRATPASQSQTVCSNESQTVIDNSLSDFKHNNNLTKDKKTTFCTQRAAAAAYHKKVTFDNDKTEED
jgi:hypothetical protein